MSLDSNAIAEVMSDLEKQGEITIKISAKNAFAFAVRAREARNHLENGSPLAFHSLSFVNAIEEEISKRSQLAKQAFDLLENPRLENGIHQVVEKEDGSKISFYAVKSGE